MGTRRSLWTLYGLTLLFHIACYTLTVTSSSKVWGEVSLPEDLETVKRNREHYMAESDDEDFIADEASGEPPESGEEEGSTQEPETISTTSIPATLAPFGESQTVEKVITSDDLENNIYIYYRALVNFTNSIDFVPALEDITSTEFQEVSEAVVDTLESEYRKIPGDQTVSLVLIKDIHGSVFVELDVGSDFNSNDQQIERVLYSVIRSGSIASYDTSVTGFQFRRLGEVTPPFPLPPEAMESPVITSPRTCTAEEFTCQDGECIEIGFRCDDRIDCRDMSDEIGCEEITTARPVVTTRPRPSPTTKQVLVTRPPPRTVAPAGRPCRLDEAVCQNGQCIPRDYLCDGERDCNDGSDELSCGTQSPCEPNEFKCQNGRCALKLWRCDGDNDCGDNSDETSCPTKGPGEECAPEQFVCVSSRQCIPASYQCDEETDCPDRSDEVGCTPPDVIRPPEETIMANKGETVQFTCIAVGVPTPIITWRLNWGHIPLSGRITMTSKEGRGTLIIRDVKDADQGAYTCEAINAKGMVFGIPDGVLIIKQQTGPCPSGYFNVKDNSRCIPCFCFGITQNCQSTQRLRKKLTLRFTEPYDFKGVNVSFPSKPASPPLTSSQILINPDYEEFQLVDLSRRFLNLESFWTLPAPFLGNKVDSYGGFLSYKVRYTLARGQTEPEERPDVTIIGNGQKLIYRRKVNVPPNQTSQQRIQFIEDNWQHESGDAVTRETLMMTLVNLDAINIRTVYDNKMVSVGLSDITMDTTTLEHTNQGSADTVEQCRCPPGYTGLSCESCAPGFERIKEGPYLGTCAGCHCNGHASTCDPVSGYCLSCQHNTEGPQCNKCKPGFFGDPRRGHADDCKPCPCPYTETSRRFSNTCFLDTDGQATCDACATGYTGRRCEKCAAGYQGNPLQPGGKCFAVNGDTRCDVRGTAAASSRNCVCKQNAVGVLCDECKTGFFHLSKDDPDGCTPCFCMGITRQCTSSLWSRDQVRASNDDQQRMLFTLSNSANTRTINTGILRQGSTELTFRTFSELPSDIYYWVLPDRFKGDKVTSYGGELSYTIRYTPRPGSSLVYNRPDVVLQGNDIFLEHFSETQPIPGSPTTITLVFRESAWRRADGQPCTREHLLMALANIGVFMIRATYAERMIESSISNIRMDIAVPYSTGKEKASEVEECACPTGYSGPSCQNCDSGYIRTSGLYLGFCEPCECYGHASQCDQETGECLQCQHNTEGPRCDRCKPGFYGNPKEQNGACRPCPCPGTSSSNQFSRTCFIDTDGQPTCDGCLPGYSGRRCERCAAGYSGNPLLGQPCRDNINGGCVCDPKGSLSDRCDVSGQCLCKMHVEGRSCSSCKTGYFHLSPDQRDGCLSCFCMGVTQQCTSSSYYRDQIATSFAPGNFQNFALLNRQRSNRISTGFTVEVGASGDTQLSYSQFNQLGQELHYWQLPEDYQGDKREAFFARMRRAHKKDFNLTEEQLRKDAVIWDLMDSIRKSNPRTKRAIPKSPAEIEEMKRLDDEIWELISSFSSNSLPPTPAPELAPPQLSSKTQSSPSATRSSSSFHSPPSSLSSTARAQQRPSPLAAPPGYSSNLHDFKMNPAIQVQRQEMTNVAPRQYILPRGHRPVDNDQYALVYKGFSLLPEGTYYWQLPQEFKGNKVGSYGGRLRYTLSYNAGARGSPLRDADVQISGNDIMLVAYHDEHLRPKEQRSFEIVFREQFWKRPDGQQATREHLLMVLADLDDILIRASYSTDMISASISKVSMDVAVPNYTGLQQALEVEQCRCPPGYQGLSCQDCSPGYTRTAGGLYLGHCEICECSGHSDSCHPETGACTNCLHNTVGEFCDQCAPGFYGDPTAGTPEDCQPCACPSAHPENSFSPTCESHQPGGYRCTACLPGHTGQYCERCATGYEGRPQEGVKCRPINSYAFLVQVEPRKAVISQGGEATLHCQASGSPPHYYYWSRGDGRQIPSSAQIRHQGQELHFSRLQPSDAGVYLCTCRGLHYANTSRAELIVTAEPSKAIQVTVEEPTMQRVSVGSTVNFICTAKSKSPAYTLVWTRQNNGKLPDRAMDFNGILTIHNVQPEDQGRYICTGSNMFDMDEGTAVLGIQAVVGVQPVATVDPPVLTIQQGQRAEFHCSVTGNPQPSIEWLGGQGNRISPHAIIQGGSLVIPAVERADEAEYLCKALNAHGEHVARAVLYVHSASLPHIQVSPQRMSANEGETVRLYCRAGGTPSPALSWKKLGGHLPSQAIPSYGFHQFKSNSLDVLQRRIEEMQARMERTDIGTLVIPSIKSSDAGIYLCVGTNAIGSSEARIEVSVIVAGSAPSPVKIEPASPTVQEGRTLDLTCLTNGSPPPAITWHRSGGSLSSNHQVSGPRLRILQASAADIGTYTCRATSALGTEEASVSLSVTSQQSRQQSPIISIEPHSAVVRQGEIASFRCRVFSGTQPIKIEWKMGNNQPLQDNVKIGPDGSVLTIASARYSNQGGYRCVASNLFGITHSIASLTVKGPPTVSVTPKGTIRVKVGEPINLECNGAGDPRPTVTWRRLNDAQKLIIQSPVPMDSNAVMQILAARHEDSGTYVCVARNQVGTVQAQVEVIVEGGPIVPTIPIASVDEPMLIVVEGGTATLRCSASGYPTPTITWSKLRAPLPWKHNIVNNTLMLPNVGRQDSGQYICNATNVMGTSEITIMLDVETLPYATTLEDSLSVQVGEVIRLQCLAHGSAPLKYQWFKVNGTLPSRARVQESTLQINLAATTDSGTYKCVVSNKVGTSESFASVTVMSHLEVRVSPHIEVKGPGSSVEFICSATGDRQTKIEWIKEGGHLPPNHRIVNGILRIENLEKANEGVYICKASSRAGQAEDRAKLTVQALPKVMINVRTQVQMVMVGNAVEFECEAIGDPKPVISWSKVDGDLPSHIMVKEGMLRIDQVKESDAGHYRCTATNEVGSVQSEVVLNVQTLPVIAAQPEVKEVTEGSTAVFPCLASGYPIPDIKWTKLEGELPSNASVEGNVLTIPFVTSVHTGTYVCTASNNQGKVQAFSMLKVRERVVPYFTQTPLSYLTLPTIKNAYKTFHIKITFRPDTPDGLMLYAGMIIYNGQKKSTGADFISFGLVGGRPEFRFDVGSGMATIRYPSPIKLGEFHTVVLYRNQTQGSIVVDGQNPVKGSSQGKFQGLDLNEQLYVGGYPDYKAISKTTGLTSGFVGCIRQLIIQDDEVIFKDLDRSSTGISNCPTCRDQPCQNGGLCRDSEASSYVCDCPRRFTGSNCEHYSALHCHPEACGPDATCINRPSGDGYDCRCHLGKSGDKCTEGTLVTTPSFNGETSFITYPPLTNIHYDLRIDLEFKPIFPDGLLFFSGGKKAKVEDFVSIAIIDRYVEFRYELGTGMAVLRSAGPLVLGRWHRITAERNNQHGTLKINDEKVISKSSPGKAQGLNIHTPMYLGGVPNLNIIPKPANISELFEGCIGEVSINGKKVDISYSFTRSEDISQCTDDSPCDRMPCLNKGTCFLTGEYEYQCICKEGYEGDRCEIIVDMCLAENPCMNGAVCTKKQCVCPMGFTGQFCEKESPIQYSAYFSDDGYMTLPKPVFPRSSPEAPETIELEIHTTSPDGVLLWQGVELGENGKGQDFISLGLENGHVVFSYQLGSGEAKIISEDPINDGDWHKVTAVRAGRHGYIQVDGDDVVTGESGGAKVMVNTKGSIYLGGTPDIEILTGGKFQSGITGCIKNLVLMNAQPGEAPHQPIDLQVHAEDGVNVKECPS
ncbi:basement membrane-specific heparan sulfate proteoglycan core protein isoform X4 [Polypterus senegalus]|uniref:basement membrane-specific heparan sulfate proteoglycan core protein isoform X4 n=1 Tax=Polypterus senegalus TaxID=55291 RepID=UPI001962EB15|nr:basement membrane-specific heparan sulfate proteoglycan core protein isoform X4 [Polypterus senegalus]